jgi:TonB family protein
MPVAAYHLKSELALACLPAPDRDAYRRLAWVNSLCLLFLLIGLLGGQSKLPVPKQAAPLEQPIPVIVEPAPAPPPAATVQKPVEQSDEEKPEAQQFVAVTLETPAIRFAVPTIGNLVVPMAVAPTPPVIPLGQSNTVRATPPALQSTGSTGQGGDRTEPPYPPMALQLGVQGTLVLLFTVDEVGAVTSISVKESSGSPLLDRAAVDWVKRKWIQPPRNGGHLFQVTISYKINSG